MKVKCLNCLLTKRGGVRDALVVFQGNSYCRECFAELLKSIQKRMEEEKKLREEKEKKERTREKKRSTRKARKRNEER